jgi:membrane-associated phospholipid phosphatase
VTEQLAHWVGVYALECFIGILVAAIAVVYLGWPAIASVYCSFERFLVRSSQSLGIRSGPWGRRLLLFFFIAAAGLVCLHLLIELAEEILEKDPIVLFDKTLAATIMGTSDPAAVKVFGVITVLGNPLILAAIAGVVGLFLSFHGRWVLLSSWLVSAGGGALGSLKLKTIFERPRPEAMFPHVPDVAGWAFPSGHAMNSVIVCGMLTYFLSREFSRLGAKAGVLIALEMVLAIGFSRIYLGVHYLSDVLAGYAAGFFWLALCISALEMVAKPKMY